APGQFHQPRGLAVDSQGNVYVADFDNHRIQKFTPNLEVIRAWGEPGNQPGQFKQPCAVAVGAGDVVYVADTWNQRVQIFDADGELLSSFAVAGWESKVFSEPYITITPGGTIFVSVPLLQVVRAYDASGNVIREWNGHEEPNGLFEKPMGVAYNAVTH